MYNQMFNYNNNEKRNCHENCAAVVVKTVATMRNNYSYFVLKIIEIHLFINIGRAKASYYLRIFSKELDLLARIYG